MIRPSAMHHAVGNRLVEDRRDRDRHPADHVLTRLAGVESYRLGGRKFYATGTINDCVVHWHNARTVSSHHPHARWQARSQAR